MILSIKAKQQSAENLSFLLHKHPDRLQSVDLPAGKAHIFYPVFEKNHCEVCLLLDINSVDLVRKSQQDNSDFKLSQYVNDRPYVATSYLSVAIAKAFSSALNGNCSAHPELIDQEFQFEVQIPTMPALKGGELLIRKLFEPLGYQIHINRLQLDNQFPEWGESRYYDCRLSTKNTLQNLLSQLYILIPCPDNHKHYWVSAAEIDKLLDKGRNWLPEHPEKRQIINRYLKDIRSLSRTAIEKLSEDEQLENLQEKDEIRKKSLHQIRLDLISDELLASGSNTILDLGCGEGKLIHKLLKHRQFSKITGMDTSYRSLEIAKERLFLDEATSIKKQRIQLIHGSLMYRDKRLDGYDAAVLSEVIEHLEPDRLDAFAKSLFGFSKPEMVIITTPNSEYNQVFDNYTPGTFRHADHRFEWTRQEFIDWVKTIEEQYDYKGTIKPIGEVDDNYGAPSQMVVFSKTSTLNSI